MLDCPDVLRGRIADRFQIPGFLTSPVCRGSNGFSGSEQVISEDGSLQSYSRIRSSPQGLSNLTNGDAQTIGHGSWSSTFTTHCDLRPVPLSTKHMVPRFMSQRPSNMVGDGLKWVSSCTGSHITPQPSSVLICQKAIKFFFNSHCRPNKLSSITLTHTQSFPSSSSTSWDYMMPRSGR